MSEIPDPIRRAMEAAGIDAAEVERQVVARREMEAAGIVPDEDALEFAVRIVDVGTGEDVTHEYVAGPVFPPEQVALFGEEPTPISYETLLPPADVATYKRVKALTMRLGDDAREIAARLVSGTVGDGQRSGKQFIRTREGLFRLATSSQSDNSTEQAAHARMGVETIKLSEPDEMISWFARHGLDGRLAYDRLVRDLRSRFHP